MDPRTELVTRLLEERLLKAPASLVFITHGFNPTSNRFYRDLDWSSVLDALRHASWGATRALENDSDPRTALVATLLINRLTVDDFEDLMRTRYGWKDGKFGEPPDWDAMLATFKSLLEVLCYHCCPSALRASGLRFGLVIVSCG